MNFWSENIDKVWHLARAYRDGGLSVFAGAGISKGCGLPLWPELVRALHKEAARRSFPECDSYGTFDHPRGWGGLSVAQEATQFQYLSSLPIPIQSRFCKSRLGNEYLSALQKVLYSNRFVVSDTVRSLSNMTNLKAICTYNYDDLVEASANTGEFVSVDGSVERDIDAVPVFHVHGLIPSDQTKLPRGDIVFSEDEYHRRYLDFGHWSNLVQLALLLESQTVLFVGLSFEDPNLRRLLDAARNVRTNLHLINICKLPFDRQMDYTGVLRPEQIQIGMMEKVYSDIGVESLWVDNFDPDIPIILQSLIADDPVENFTRKWRETKLTTLMQMPTGGHCAVNGCGQAAVTDFGFCVHHVMGDQQRFSEYAPMPKSLNDKCSVVGCDRITSGLSGTCVGHFRIPGGRTATSQ